MKVYFKKFFSGLLASFKPSRPIVTAFALGGLSVGAFAPINFAPLAMIALAGLFWLWLRANTKFESFRLGLWFGLGQFGFGVSWLISSMYFYSNMSLPVSALATLVFVLFLSLYVGLAGLVAQFFKDDSRPTLNLLLVFPLVWVSFEWIRSTLFGGFPFLLMGNSHLDTWLDGYAPVFGVLGVSWAIALTAASLLWIVTQRAWILASGLLAVVWLVGAGLQQIEWVKPLDKPVKIALVQGNVPQEEKWRAEAFMPTMKTYVDLTKENIGYSDIIVWPETAIPAYLDVVQRGALKSFLRDAQLLEADILVGVITRNEDKTEYYNAIVNAHNPAQEYRKHHLVPFSEFFPFTGVFKALSNLFDIPFATFTEGEYMQKPMRLGGHDVGVSVCYETAFGEELAAQLQNAKFLITVSNDAWFAHTLEPAQQLQEVQMRALELGREIARSTNTGFTAIVDVKGRIKQQIPAYQTGVLKGEIQPYDGKTFFAQWQQMPLLFLWSLIYGFLFAKYWLMKARNRR